MIEIVFLDAGETILHPHPSFPELFARTCREHGYEVSPEKVAPVLYGMVRDMGTIAAEIGDSAPSTSAAGSYSLWTHIYRRCLDGLGIPVDTLPDELYKVFSDSATYRLYPDALPAVDRLRADGYRVGLISNFEGWLEEMLVELQAGDVFEVSVISGLVGVEKPDPRIYEMALEQAGVEPGAAAHVGDSIRLDVEPATAVGINAVLLDRSGAHPDTEWPTIGSLEELPAIIANL
ncbi:MAG TPA: HAD-IA family hydrolase [Actinomycetota bacterium]|jgi:putative hydrolase of the HAD superfamily|nr:HAD-IA family hydrolase [Actinomycetota bacterium]